MKIKPANKIRGTVVVPGDKSITHRAFLFSAMSTEKCVIHDPLICDDTLRTLHLIEAVGAKIDEENEKITITPPDKFIEPSSPIYCGNSGTTARIGMGLLAVQNIFSILWGDKSLSKRPMKRVAKPLRMLGAKIDGRGNASNLPFSIRGGNLKGTLYESELSSAQVKSSFIFAALGANGDSTYIEKVKSRDHTERFLSQFGIVEINANGVKIHPSRLPPFTQKIVGDFSSASFFLTLGVIHPNAHLRLERVGVNPTRTGFLNVLKRMNANLKVENFVDDVEPQADIVVESSNLTATQVSPFEIPALIDEIPLIALLGVFARGETIVKGASELRKKESDRIKATVNVLKKMGADIEEMNDGFSVRGPSKLKWAKVNPFSDHRIAMLASVAGACSEGVDIENSKCVWVSYPSFYSDLKKVMK